MLLSGHSHRGRTESLPPDSPPQLGGAAELSEVALLGETIEHVSFITVFKVLYSQGCWVWLECLAGTFLCVQRKHKLAQRLNSPLALEASRLTLTACQRSQPLGRSQLIASLQQIGRFSKQYNYRNTSIIITTPHILVQGKQSVEITLRSLRISLHILSLVFSMLHGANGQHAKLVVFAICIAPFSKLT